MFTIDSRYNDSSDSEEEGVLEVGKESSESEGGGEEEVVPEEIPVVPVPEKRQRV